MSSTNPVKPGLGYIDTGLTNIFLPTIKYWHSIGVTPNILTTLGLISSALCVYNLYNKNINLAVIFLILRCYFDYSDGLLARKYNQETDFGDWYDHIVDITFTLFFVIVLYMKSKHRKLHFSLLVIFGILMIIQFGCVEKDYRDDKDSETSISRLRRLCIEPKLMKFFDNGTLYAVMIFIIVTTHRSKLFTDNKVNSYTYVNN